MIHFHLKIAKISLQKQNFPVMRFPKFQICQCMVLKKFSFPSQFCSQVQLNTQVPYLYGKPVETCSSV